MTTDQMVKELGIQDSDDTFKAQMIGKIMATADLRFARVVDEIMTDKERQEFEQFSEGKDPEEISLWVEEKYEGIGAMYDAIVETIVSDLKNKSS